MSCRAFLVLLLVGCSSSGRVATIDNSTPETPEVIGSLRWSPPLIDALGDDPATPERDLVTIMPVTLEWCSSSGACRAVVTIEAPRVVRGEAASPDGRYAVIEHGAPGGASGLGFYDARKGVELAWVILDGNAHADLQWTAGNNLLRSWSGGSDDSLATLYDAHGAVVASFEAPVLFTSPDLRFLVEYTPTWAPKALSRSYAIHDLSTGAELTSLRIDLAGVDDVEWREDSVVITYRSSNGQTHQTVYSTR